MVIMNDQSDGADYMKFVAEKTVHWFARHQTVLKKQSLRYVDHLCDALLNVDISTPLPEVLAQLVPGMSQSCALELLDLKFHRFSSGGFIEGPGKHPDD
jgi:hypothetical protein